MRGARIGICGVLAVAFLGIPLAGCGGGSNTSTDQSLQEQLRRARQEGARDQRIKELERQIREQKKKSSQSSPPQSSPPQKAPPSSGTSSCGDGLSVGPNTSCAFAENVRSAYPGSSYSFQAYSPTTGKLYTMSCTTSSPHVCTGGNNASVYFP